MKRLGNTPWWNEITAPGHIRLRYSAAENAHILWGANVKSDKAAEQLIERLNAKALCTKDASSIEAVQVPFASSYSKGVGVCGNGGGGGGQTLRNATTWEHLCCSGWGSRSQYRVSTSLLRILRLGCWNE